MEMVMPAPIKDNIFICKGIISYQSRQYRLLVKQWHI